jgi:hypothetical protein
MATKSKWSAGKSKLAEAKSKFFPSADPDFSGA